MIITEDFWIFSRVLGVFLLHPEHSLVFSLSGLYFIREIDSESNDLLIFSSYSEVISDSFDYLMLTTTSWFCGI